MKKALAIALAVLLLTPSMGFIHVSAAPVDTTLYENSFDAQDTSVVTDASTDSSTINIYSEQAFDYDKETNPDRMISISRGGGSYPAGKFIFSAPSDIYSQSDNNLMIEVSYDATVVRMSTIKATTSSKEMTSDFVLGTSNADAKNGSFGGIRFKTKIYPSEVADGPIVIDPWSIYFISADGTLTSLAKDLPDSEFSNMMTNLKVQYIFREGGKDKNIARVWVDGSQFDGDIPLGVEPSEKMKDAGSFMIKAFSKDKSPRSVINNLTVKRIVDNDTPVEPETTPDPDEPSVPTSYPKVEPIPGVSPLPVPADEAETPDFTAKSGYLLKTALESANAGTPEEKWSLKKGAVVEDAENAVAETGKIISVTGTAETEVTANVLFAPTYTLDGPPPTERPEELDALEQEGEGCVVVTEFDIMSSDIAQRQSNGEVFLQKSANNASTPITRLMFNGKTQTIQMTYDTTSTPKDFAEPYPFVDGKWYRIRVTFYVTGESTTDEEGLPVPATALKQMSVSINGELVLNKAVFGSSSPGKTGFYDQILARVRKVVGTISIDNLSVYKYNNASAAAGVGTPLDKAKLISLVRDTQAKLATTQTGTADDQYSSESRSFLINAAVRAVEVYRNSELTQEQVNSEVAAMQAALDNYLQNGQKLHVLAPEFYRADGITEMTELSQSDILKTKIKVVVGINQPEFETATLIVALYKGSPLSGQNKTLLQVVSSDQLPLTAGQTQELAVDLDLSEYAASERSGMFVQLMVWDSMDGLKPILGCVSTL